MPRASHWELGLAVIMATHDLLVVAEVCGRAAVMYAGEIVESGATRSLLDDPRHPYTRMLFAATPELDGDRPLASIPGAPPRLDLPTTGCPFRPRCDSSLAACRVEHPPDLQVGDQHRASCHLNAVPAPEARA